jgi:hypothetical protein
VELKVPDVAGDVTVEIPNTAISTEAYVDAAVAAIPEIAGIGPNVVSATKVDTFSASVASVAEVDVTNLEVVITPTSNTSKVLIRAVVAASCDDNFGIGLLIQRNGTTIGAGTDRGNKLGISGAPYQFISANKIGPAVFEFLDSPASTSALTYKVRLRNLRAATQNLYVNRAATEIFDRADFPSASSTITVIEVAV